MLAVSYAVPPVLWAVCVMSKCKDNYSIFIRSTHKRKRKFREEHSSSVLRRWRPSKRVGRGREQWHLQPQQETDCQAL